MRILMFFCRKSPLAVLRLPKAASGAFGPLTKGVKGVAFARSTRASKGATFAPVLRPVESRLAALSTCTAKGVTFAVLIPLIAATLVAGCGFQLQGRARLPDPLSRAYVEARDKQSDFVQGLRKALIT